MLFRSESVGLMTIRLWEQRVYRWMDAYRSGLDARAAQIQVRNFSSRKYKSHRRVPEAIARQFVKNKRGYAYRQGLLERKDKYSYLKDNAAKRTNAPRGNGKRKATSDRSTRPAKRTKVAKTTSRAKGKAAAAAAADNDTEEEEDGEGGKESDEGENEED